MTRTDEPSSTSARRVTGSDLKRKVEHRQIGTGSIRSLQGQENSVSEHRYRVAGVEDGQRYPQPRNAQILASAGNDGGARAKGQGRPRETRGSTRSPYHREESDPRSRHTASRAWKAIQRQRAPAESGQCLQERGPAMRMHRYGTDSCTEHDPRIPRFFIDSTLCGQLNCLSVRSARKHFSFKALQATGDGVAF